MALYAAAMAVEWWDQHQCSAHWGIAASTWRSYVTRGTAPQPAPTRDPKTGNRRWRADDVRNYPRPGQGTGGGRPPAEKPTS